MALLNWSDQPVFVLVLEVLAFGAFLGLVVRFTLGRRTSLSASATVLIGIAGAGLGSIVPFVFAREPGRPTLVPLVLASLLGTAVIFLIAQRLARPQPPVPDEVIAGGESARVEFKTSARHNVHSNQRDDRIEAATAKTVAGFLNAGGGVLMIGVDDAGQVVGLDADLRYMKQPDIDRYELWLTDYLTRCLGAAALADLTITFPRIRGGQVCQVYVRPSTRPVFAQVPKSDAARFFVRIGNSTRDLPVDQAVAYCADRYSPRRMRTRRRAGGQA